jgi:hypothetical protein
VLDISKELTIAKALSKEWPIKAIESPQQYLSRFLEGLGDASSLLWPAADDDVLVSADSFQLMWLPESLVKVLDFAGAGLINPTSTIPWVIIRASFELLFEVPDGGTDGHGDASTLYYDALQVATHPRFELLGPAFFNQAMRLQQCFLERWGIAGHATKVHLCFLQFGYMLFYFVLSSLV